MRGWGHPQLNPGAAGILYEVMNIVSAPAVYQMELNKLSSNYRKKDKDHDNNTQCSNR